MNLYEAVEELRKMEGRVVSPKPNLFGEIIQSIEAAFTRKDANASKPPQGERVLLHIEGEDNPVVGYWGSSFWEICDCNLEARSNARGIEANVEANFRQSDVTHYTRINLIELFEP